ncbi:MAG: hypothetical protein ACLQPH_01325 [Acidimicrobiales bacterium]
MDVNLLYGFGPLGLLLVTGALLLVAMSYPLVKRYPDEQGDGMALVLLPKPTLPSFWSVPILIVLFLLMFVGYHSLQGDYSPDLIYADFVTRICDSVVRSPAEIAGYMAGFTLGLRFLIFGTIMCEACLGQGNVLRRMLVAGQVFVYLVVMAFLDATLVCLEVLLGVPIALTTLLGNFAAVALAVLTPDRPPGTWPVRITQAVIHRPYGAAGDGRSPGASGGGA